jgi:hypothetical protein
MLKEMPELRAPEKSRIGIEIKPKVRYPDQTEAAIVHSTIVLIASLLDRARAIRVVSLDDIRHFIALDFVQLSKLEAGYLGEFSGPRLGMVFTLLVQAFARKTISKSRPLCF